MKIKCSLDAADASEKLYLIGWHSAEGSCKTESGKEYSIAVTGGCRGFKVGCKKTGKSLHVSLEELAGYMIEALEKKKK